MKQTTLQSTKLFQNKTLGNHDCSCEVSLSFIDGGISKQSYEQLYAAVTRAGQLDDAFQDFTNQMRARPGNVLKFIDVLERLAKKDSLLLLFKQIVWGLGDIVDTEVAKVLL